MSGIAGLYYLDGRPVRRPVLEGMAESMASRGPDGSGIWTQGPVGLCHLMLWTTPESCDEQLPLVNETGDVALTADARIDNREELIEALGMHSQSRPITDSALILRAYETWGEICPEKLLGDFAFTVWDGRQQMLFCARDHFGVKPFYYYYSGHLFAFASEIKALLCLEEIPRRLHEMRVADYLGGTAIDPASTFYQGVVELAAAHSLAVGHQRVARRRYWALDPSCELRLSSDAEYAEAFREHFTQAVRARLRSRFALGAMLSGGLDSSAVVCVARRLLAGSQEQQLHTFSAVFDDLPQCDERSFINAVTAEGGLTSHYVIGDRLNPWADIDVVLRQQEEPFESPFLFVRRALCAMARDAGVRVLADGFLGDVVVSHGMGRVTELLRQGRWWAFVTQILALQRTVYSNYQVSLGSLLWERGIRPLAPQLVVQAGRGWRRKVSRHQEPLWAPILHPHFARRMHLAERLAVLRDKAPGPVRTAREEHWRFLASGFSRGFTISDKAAAAFGLSASHPFADPRLAAFCLALPAEQKLHQGWTRLVVRRAMVQILPESVQWRRDKANHHSLVMSMLFGAAHRAMVEGVIRKDTEVIRDYVDLAALRATYHRHASWDARRGDVSGSATQDALRLWRTLLFTLWLKCSGLSA